MTVGVENSFRVVREIREGDFAVVEELTKTRTGKCLRGKLSKPHDGLICGMDTDGQTLNENIKASTCWFAIVDRP